MKKKINIVLFAYNFPHRKTIDIITTLYENGFTISLVLAANFIKIKSPKSAFVFKRIDLKTDTKKLAIKYDIPFYVVKHNSLEASRLLKQYKINFGIISGARILKPNIIKSVEHGILNIHPALLPFIRGLDSILWSIDNNYPLGATAHLINAKIDAGFLVCQKKIQISIHDNLESLYEKNYQLQLDLLPISLNLILSKNNFKMLTGGKYNKKMSYTKQLGLMKKINRYIEKNAS